MELSIFAATPQQTEISRKRTGASPWGNGMTLDQYVQRDLELEESECGIGGKYMTWVLAPRNDPETLDFLCSCETFRRTGLTARKNSTEVAYPEPLIEEVVCYGIASVFTPPSSRGKGYARLMMSLLHWVLGNNDFNILHSDVRNNNAFPSDIWGMAPIPAKELGMGNAVFSALWSDVGYFYEKCAPVPDHMLEHTKNPKKNLKNGWIVRGTRTTAWRPRDDPDASVHADTSSASGRWRWLTSEEVDQLCVYDAERMRIDLRARWLDIQSSDTSTSFSSTKALFTFLPSGGVEAFQRERLRPFWEKDSKGIVHWGVVLLDSRNDLSAAQAFATWTLEFRPPAPRKLIVTRLYCAHRLGQSDVPCQLLQRIWDYSIKHDIQVVEIWNFPVEMRDVGYECARRWFVPYGEKGEFERKEHLPAFKWYGHGRGLGEDLEEHEAEWMFNERFCWC